MVPRIKSLSERHRSVAPRDRAFTPTEIASDLSYGLPRAFADVAELIAAPEVDIVTVTVKVPPHFEIVKAAIEAGKHVYCEWPLGNGLADARPSPDVA